MRKPKYFNLVFTGCLISSLGALSFSKPAQAGRCSWWEFWCNEPIPLGRPLPKSNPAQPPPPERIGFSVCNRSREPAIYVAFLRQWRGDFGPDGMGAREYTETAGWWTIASGQCKQVYNGSAKTIRGVYANSKSLTWQGRSEESIKLFCIHPSSAFVYKSMQAFSTNTCTNQGGKMVKFQPIQSNSEEYTQPLY
jgi:uncharacterized membrane protein